MDAIEDHKEYEIKHPRTGKKEVWTGERIRLYQQTYGGTIKFPPPPPPPPKKETEKIENNE